MQPRHAYVDIELSRRVADDLVGLIERSRARLEAEPGVRAQTICSSLASSLKMLAGQRYVLGAPLSEVSILLRQHAEMLLRVFELRGTEAPIPWEIVTLNPSSPHSAPEVLSRESVFAAGESDESLTNSRSGRVGIYVALTAGHVLVASRLAQLLWDPPTAAYIGEDSEVCTPDDQRLAYSLRALYAGETERAREEVMLVSGRRRGLEIEKRMLIAILDQDAAMFCAGLAEYLAHHAREARRKRNRMSTDLFLAYSALGLTALAIRGKVIAHSDLPNSDPFFPVDIDGLRS